MKLKLKENMYVRNCYGRIAKIEYIEDNTTYCDNWLYQSYEDHITFINLDDEEDIDEILKASYNIIDILEVGDIILFYEDIDNYKKQYAIGIPDLITLDEIKDKITNDNIRLVSILTKEEMEQMAYRVEE